MNELQNLNIHEVSVLKEALVNYLENNYEMFVSEESMEEYCLTQEDKDDFSRFQKLGIKLGIWEEVGV